MTSYKEDYFAWTQETARAIKEGRFEEVDRNALADEVESMGLEFFTELRNRLRLILVHLLKIKYQPNRISRSWHLTIREQQIQVEIILRENPSLKPLMPEVITRAYTLARFKAARETGLLLEMFPKKCEFTTEEILGNETDT